MTAHFAIERDADLLALSHAVADSICAPVNLDRTVTPRQLEVMLKLCQGKVTKQIAYEMDVSMATVKAHIRNAITRLGAKNRVHAAAMVAANCALLAGRELQKAEPAPMPARPSGFAVSESYHYA
jgi:DNA-binding CsgD family transcriptional regulator